MEIPAASVANKRTAVFIEFAGRFGDAGSFTDEMRVPWKIVCRNEIARRMKFVDAQGKPLKSRESWSSAEFRNIGLDAPPPPDTQLVIQLATPESVKSFPFKVENIPLP